jgi:hypothetical protein
MGKLDPYLLILVGSIPALITLLITQIVTFARDNRNLLLEKYEEALISDLPPIFIPRQMRVSP